MSTLDRDAARAWLLKQFSLPNLPDEITEEELDALEGCVRPGPAQTIDREELVWAISNVLMRVYDNGSQPNARAEAEEVVSVVLALLHPLDGVTLTRDEAFIARQWARLSGPAEGVQDAALRNRLDEAMQ